MIQHINVAWCGISDIPRHQSRVSSPPPLFLHIELFCWINAPPFSDISAVYKLLMKRFARALKTLIRIKTLKTKRYLKQP